MIMATLDYILMLAFYLRRNVSLIMSSTQNILDREEMEVTTYSYDTQDHSFGNMSRGLTNNPPKMTTSDYLVAFSGLAQNFCVGIIDIVNSTIVSANLEPKEICEYYSFFINSMSEIITKFHGQVVKNMGDCLLYYFPESVDCKRKEGLIKCLECILSMSSAHLEINKKLSHHKLPRLDYRISADYGSVLIMKVGDDTRYDIFGPTVNMCSKINHIAENNEVVIGGDLYQVSRRLNNYTFKEVKSYSIGLKFQYPVYSVTYNHQH